MYVFLFPSWNLTIAKLVDPDGYAKQVYALKEADSSTKNKIRKYVNGYYWDFYVNNLSYRIEFSKNTYSLSCHGLETTGKYTICNGYVILTNDSTGAKSYLPYTLESNDIDLDITAGFDVFENWLFWKSLKLNIRQLSDYNKGLSGQ